LIVLRGEGKVTLGSDEIYVRAGSFAHMTANLPHAIVAATPLVMALIMIKGLRSDGRA
jgi:quercetin dioxygenase-like cupin family protein